MADKRGMRFLEKGGKGKSEEMKWREKAAQALINPYQPLRFTMDMRSGARVRGSSSSPCVLHPPPPVSFTPTEIIVIGVARRLHGLTRAHCNLRCDASSSGSVPLSSTILIDRRTSAFLVFKIVMSISSIYLLFESLIQSLSSISFTFSTISSMQ